MTTPSDARRSLPAVGRLLEDPKVATLPAPRAVVVEAAREILAEVRDAVATLPGDWAQAIAERVAAKIAPTLRPVLNGTGVVLHTNLGRAPLARAALDAILEVAGGYSALEFDLDSGERGSRTDHCRRILREVSGAGDALVVNNAAGALVLTLNAVAVGREVILSRGELIEIGGAFRIPEILAKSGATLVEVGTTNRTHVADYQKAITDRTGAILTVHRSNFEQRGFVTSPEPHTLAALAADHGLPFLHDIGSGLVADLSPWGLRGEPRVSDAVGTADLVIFSGDKLLGGPQAGCMAGRTELVALARANPLARALRADKLTLAALAATLTLYRDPALAVRDVPVLAMLTADPAVLAERAASLAKALPTTARARTLSGNSAVGGGAFPEASLPTTLVLLDPVGLDAGTLARRLRLGQPSLVTRIRDGLVVLDPRTLPDEATGSITTLVRRALAAG